MKNSPTDRFLREFRRRATLSTALRALVWCLTGAVIAVLAYAVYWRVRGYQVPWDFYPILLFWAVAVAGLWTLAKTLSPNEAAGKADAHFGLKDGLSSQLRFDEEEQKGEVYDLQREKIAQELSTRQAKDLPLATPWRVACFSAGGLILAVWLATLPNSEAVQARLDSEAEMLTLTTSVKEQLEEAVEELLKGLDEDEKAALDVEQMKEWVKELEETKDQKEALRQLARFEQKVAKAMQGLEARKDEEALKLAAAELDKSDLAAARQVGQKLDRKDFKAAALELEKLKPTKKDPQGRELTPEERKKMLQKLREATRRMANGAKGRENKANAPNAPNGKANAKEMQAMDELLDELDRAAEKFDQEMGDLEEMDGEFPEGDLDKALENFENRMKNLDARRKLRGKLSKMRQKLGRGQGQVAGLGRGPSGRQPGGLQPGSGTDASRREGETKLPDQMAAERLKGLKGSGPSQSSVEDAESGTGISGRRSAVQERTFARQMESFVARDDVPEEMKVGVREYFERIHEADAASE